MTDKTTTPVLDLSDALDFDLFEGDFGEPGDSCLSNKIVTGRGVYVCHICAGGMRQITLTVTDAQYQAYERNAQLRRPGKKAYTVEEYAELLFVQDELALKNQLAELSKASCPDCGEALPGPAGGCWRNGESVCGQTHIWKELALKTL